MTQPQSEEKHDTPDSSADRASDQLVDEKRMADMAVAPPEPTGETPGDVGETADPRKHEKGEALQRSDDDGMGQVPREELDDARRDESNLEDGLEDSMDASDPPASLQP